MLPSCLDKNSICYWEDAQGYAIAPCTETFPLRHQNQEGFTFFVLEDGTYAQMESSNKEAFPITDCGDGLFMEYPWVSFEGSLFQAPPQAPALDEKGYFWVARNPRVCGYADGMYLDILDVVRDPHYQLPESEYLPPIVKTP